MTLPPPDGSRDRRIEDPTNRWIVHPLARALLRPALASGVSANAVSVTGLFVGAGAAWSFAHSREPDAALLGLLLATGWLVLDGLDGMVARATGTTSALGRFLDGLCDHGVFALIYVGLALSIGTPLGWLLCVAAGAAHAVQSNLYEGERARYHRRVKGLPFAPPPTLSGLVRLYDNLSTAIDRRAGAFERALIADPSLAACYARAAAAPMRLEALLSANTRVLAIAAACLFDDPRLFWLFEIGPLGLVAIAGIAWHRRVEATLARRSIAIPPGPAAGRFRFMRDRTS
jgi:CDP-diacylglycerol--serine O-phosphatidyltransferase